MMQIKRHQPIAEQVTQILHQRIVDGNYLPGSKLPSEEDLAIELGVSRGTTRSALASLAAAGLLSRKQGDGTYVRLIDSSQNSLMHAIWEYTRMIEESGRRPNISCLSIEKRNSSRKESVALEIEPQEIMEIIRIFYADDKPIIYSVNIFPVRLLKFNGVNINGNLGIQEFTKTYAGLEIDRVDVNISPVLPPDKVRSNLLLGERKPILRIEETFRDCNKTPIIFASNYHAEDKLNLNNIRPWYSLG